MLPLEVADMRKQKSKEFFVGLGVGIAVVGALALILLTVFFALF